MLLFFQICNRESNGRMDRKAAIKYPSITISVYVGKFALGYLNGVGPILSIYTPRKNKRKLIGTRTNLLTCSSCAYNMAPAPRTRANQLKDN